MPDAELKLEYYMLDWDDNILHMPTVIHYVDESARPSRPRPLTTADLAEDNARPEGEKKLDGSNPAFTRAPDWDRGFKDEFGDFVVDTVRAIEYRGFGPSYEAFKKALIEARLFCIVSARGHAPDKMRAGVEALIEKTFDDAQRARMVENIEAWNRRANRDPADPMDDYLSLNGYFGVTYGKGGDVDIPALKMAAIREFVSTTMELTEPFRTEGSPKVSFGFSDDDRHNIASMAEGLRELQAEINQRHPDVAFFEYGFTEDGDWVRKAV